MKTPRTDERATWIGKPERDGAEVVMADFARKLETELAEALHQVDKYAAEAKLAIEAHESAFHELAEANAGIAQWAQTCGQYKTERDDVTKQRDMLVEALDKSLANLKGENQ